MVKTDMAFEKPVDEAVKALRNLAERVSAILRDRLFKPKGRRERASGAKGCTVWLEKPQEDKTNQWSYLVDLSGINFHTCKAAMKRNFRRHSTLGPSIVSTVKCWKESVFVTSSLCRCSSPKSTNKASACSGSIAIRK